MLGICLSHIHEDALHNAVCPSDVEADGNDADDPVDRSPSLPGYVTTLSVSDSADVFAR